MSAYIQWVSKAGVTLQLFFDVVLQETQEMTSAVTEHPVEKGANVTDHVRAENDRVSLEVYVSNSPARDVNNRGMTLESMTLDIPVIEPASLSIGGLINGAFNALQGSKGPERTATVYKFSNAFDAVSDTRAILEELRTSATLLDVVTSSKDFQNMVLRSHTIKKNESTGTGATFALEFQQIRLVETKIVNAPIPTETRGKKAVSKGAQGTKPAKDQPKKKSLLKTLLGAA